MVLNDDMMMLRCSNNTFILHLHEEAKVGEHGKSAILDLLHAQLSEAVGVISKAQGVKCLTCKSPE